jgi:hypothetical protein
VIRLYKNFDIRLYFVAGRGGWGEQNVREGENDLYL